MARRKILIVEDEPKQARLVRDYLEKADYAVSTLDRGDGVAAHIRSQPPDAVLLDLMLPGLDGLGVCREIRAFSDVPILMITARVEEIDRLLGLEMGADDYICKPYSPREVVARVRAVLRRAAPRTGRQMLRAGQLDLDEASHTARAAGERLDLTPSEFKLLKTLMARPGRVFSRAELVYRVQGFEFDGYERTMDSHIKNLRRKLADRLPGANPIKTVYGVGYRFETPEDDQAG